MKIRPEEVRRIAELAEIAVSEDELPALVQQLDRIVGYVAQLDSVTADNQVVAFVPGPQHSALREDVVRPTPLEPPPAAMAPAWREGYFTVPRLSAMEDA
jgi:aspartyl-tRNA(Asn)/glutamyl-tRNA(Gln) amidotransferase subunit C